MKPFRFNLISFVKALLGMQDPPPPPTPLEIASRSLVDSQRELLQAQADYEQSKHTVAMLNERIGRLRCSIRDLSSEPAVEGVTDLVRPPYARAPELQPRA